jgi:hypothetical protein
MTDADSSDAWMEQVGPEFLEKQERLLDYTTWLEDQPSFADSGYLTSVLDINKLAIRLLWKGHSDLQTVTEREARRRGIEFSIEPRPHSRQDLDELAYRIYGGADRLRELGFEIAGISAVREEPGPIVVEGQLAAGRRSPAQLSLVEDLASELAGERVAIKDVNPDRLAVVTRQTETAPGEGVSR